MPPADDPAAWPRRRFLCPVARSGYFWQRYPPSKINGRLEEISPELVVRDPQQGYLWIDPFAMPHALHRALALLIDDEEDDRPSESAVLEFANTWGFLVHHHATDLREPHEEWAAALPALTRAIAVYDAIQAADSDLLGAWLASDDSVSHRPFEEEIQHLVVSRTQLAALTNDQILGLASERLLRLEIRDYLAYYTRPDIVIDEHDQPGRVEVRPHSLLGAAWLEFAETVLGQRTFRQCAYCPQFFGFAPGRSRVDKRFCSDVCRVAAWRARSQPPSAVPNPRPLTDTA